jgi:PAS domain S-box-containing protein
MCEGSESLAEGARSGITPSARAQRVGLLLGHPLPRIAPSASITPIEASLRRLVLATQLYPLVGGFVSLLGWGLDLPHLTDWTGSDISIQPNTALAAMLGATSLLALACGRRRVSAALGAVVACIGATVLFQHATRIDLGIDRVFLFGRTWGSDGALSPGRMGPAGATSWTLLGSAMVLIAGTRISRARAAAVALGILTAAISSLSLVGYLYGVQALYTLPTATIIAPQAATFVLAISLGVLMSLPERWPVRLFVGEGIGATLVRGAAPILVLVPVLVGLLRVAGESAGLYHSAFGSAMRTLVEIAVLLLLLGWAAKIIAREAERRRASEAAREQIERRLTGTLESMTDGFIMLDGDLRFTYVNREAERLLGKSARELLGQQAWDVFPESRDSHADDELRSAIATHNRADFEEYNPKMQKWFACRAYRAPDGGLAVYFQDITVRKRADDALHAAQSTLAMELADAKLLHAISVAIAEPGTMEILCENVVEAAVAIMRSDFASLQMCAAGGPAAGELRLLTARGFGPGAGEGWQRGAATSPTSCGAALATRQRVVVADVEACETIAGTAELMSCRTAGIRALQTTPLLSRTGATVGMLSTHWREPHTPSERDFRLLDILARQAADFIERMRYEAERDHVLEREKTARHQAEHVARIKDEFLATLSHELRTPLSAIMGWTHILRQDLGDRHKAEAAIEVLERNGKLQAQLIADMLDMSRIVSGKMRLDVKRVDLPEVVAAAIASVQPMADAKGVRLADLVEHRAIPVDGDAARLQQVAWNLLSNAVKFTPRNGRVEVALRRTNGHVELVVSDSGEGISPEFLPRIFQRFSQADASTSRPHGGLGIGLALVKELAELHGGRVRVASEGVGKGATFVVELPLAVLPDAAGTPPAPELLEEAGEAPAVSLRGVAVLVVDDEPDALALSKRLLEGSGARVAVTSSGAQALDVLRAQSFDVLVSDIGMPGMDGYVLLGEVRRRGIDTPALALTAFARPVDRARAMLSGYQAHLSKPVGAAELLATVAALARRVGAPGPAVES